MSDSQEASTPKTTPLATAERRTHERDRFESGRICHFVTFPDCRGRQAILYDISVVGIAMVMNEPLDTGREVVIRLPPRGTFRGRSLVGQIAHVMPLSNGRWRIGCAFGKSLSEAEVAELL